MTQAAQASPVLFLRSLTLWLVDKPSAATSPVCPHTSLCFVLASQVASEGHWIPVPSERREAFSCPDAAADRARGPGVSSAWAVVDGQ